MEQVYKLEIFVPERQFEVICSTLWEVDAGHIGGYDRCLSWSRVESCWRPLEGASPYHGTVGQVQRAKEVKVEVCCLGTRLQETLSALRRVHPYEEAVIHVIPLTATGLEVEQDGD